MLRFRYEPLSFLNTVRSRYSPPSPWNSTTGRPSPKGISPASIAVCALATLVALPVILASRAGGDSEVVVTAAAPATSQTEVASSEIEVDVSRLFDAGADASEMSLSGSAVVVGPDDLTRQMLGNETEAPNQPSTLRPPSGSGVTTDATNPAGGSEESGSDKTEATDAPSTEAPTSEAPVTAAPTTAAPTTAAPTTAAPATTSPPATEAPVTEAPKAEEPSEASSGEPTADQWANLRQCESGGNYQIASSNGLYFGAYQFGIGTWDGVANAAGRDDLVGVLPSDASPSDQDAMALALWRSSGASPWPHCGSYIS